MAPHYPGIATDCRLIETRIRRKPWGKASADATSPGWPNLPLWSVSGPRRESGAAHARSGAPSEALVLILPIATGNTLKHGKRMSDPGGIVSALKAITMHSLPGDSDPPLITVRPDGRPTSRQPATPYLSPTAR